MSNGTEYSLLFHNNWVLQVQHTTALTRSPSEQPCSQGLWASATWKEFWYGTGTSFCTISQSRLDFCPTFPALGFRLFLLLPTLW